MFSETELSRSERGDVQYEVSDERCASTKKYHAKEDVVIDRLQIYDMVHFMDHKLFSILYIFCEEITS